MKCLAPTFLGDFKLKGSELRANGLNRLGNLLIPNQNYCLFEDWLTPILNAMADEQVRDGIRWTPSKIIHRLGKEINHEDSVYYWAYRNNIPVFCPALTDGSLGDMMYFNSYKRPEFSVDIVEDIRAINDIAVKAHCTGMYGASCGFCDCSLFLKGHTWRRTRETPHLQRQSNAQWRRLFRVHQHWTGKILLESAEPELNCCL